MRGFVGSGAVLVATRVGRSQAAPLGNVEVCQCIRGTGKYEHRTVNANAVGGIKAQGGFLYINWCTPAECALDDATAVCNAGACAIGSCNAGFDNCDRDPTNACETNFGNDVDNCGSCGFTCSSKDGTASCSVGICSITCNAGFDNCDGDATNGCETNLDSDVANCGGCGQVCSSNHVPSPTCSRGVCNGVCETGWADCNNDKRPDGCEADLSSNATCGTCTTICAHPQTCSGGGQARVCGCTPNCTNKTCLDDNCCGSPCPCPTGRTCLANATCAITCDIDTGNVFCSDACDQESTCLPEWQIGRGICKLAQSTTTCLQFGTAECPLGMYCGGGDYCWFAC